MNDKTNAPTPARMVQVCPDCGSRDAQVTAWIDANTSQLMDDEGPLGGAWCPACETDDHGLIEASYCVACDAKGWEVFDRDNTREVQRCTVCARLDSHETAAQLVFGSGLQVASSGEVEPDAEELWRTDYRTLRGLTRNPSTGPLKLGHIAYALAERIAHSALGDVIEGVRAGEHYHDGTPGQDAFEFYVDDHGTRRRFVVAVFGDDPMPSRASVEAPSAPRQSRVRLDAAPPRRAAPARPPVPQARRGGARGHAVTEERRRRSTGAVENLDVPTYRTLAGDELDYPEPSEQLARFLDRVTEAANDPAIGADVMTDLIYGPDNPLLGPSTSALPERHSVSRETWDDPTWHMMLDLLEAKRIAIAESSPTMSLEEAGELLGITEDAVRKAAIAGTLDGEKRANRWHVTPGSVATYRDRVRRRGRWPATPLLVRCGRENGYSMSTKTANPSTKKRVRRGVVDVTIPDFERMLIQMRWTNREGDRTRRVLVLEPDPSADPWTFTWPPRSDGKSPFFIKGRFRIAQKLNNSARAKVAWKEIEPA